MNDNPLFYESIPKESKEERKIYLETLRMMTPSEKFNKVMELSEPSKSLCKQGFRVSAKTPPASQKNKFMRYYVHEW